MQTTALVRVPFEMVKQRAQANLHMTPYKIIRHILQTQVDTVQYYKNVLPPSLRASEDCIRATSTTSVVR